MNDYHDDDDDDDGLFIFSLWRLISLPPKYKIQICKFNWRNKFSACRFLLCHLETKCTISQLSCVKKNRIRQQRKAAISTLAWNKNADFCWIMLPLDYILCQVVFAVLEGGLLVTVIVLTGEESGQRLQCDAAGYS
jgi:hypothetical protein